MACRPGSIDSAARRRLTDFRELGAPASRRHPALSSAGWNHLPGSIDSAGRRRLNGFRELGAPASRRHPALSSAGI